MTARKGDKRPVKASSAKGGRKAGRKAEKPASATGEGRARQIRTKEEKDALIAAVIQDVADGSSATVACRARNLAYMTFADWIGASKELSVAYARARDTRADRLADEIIEISNRPAPTTESGATDSGDVQHRKLQIDTRKWLLSKIAPSRYGDRMEVEHGGTVGLTINVNRSPIA